MKIINMTSHSINIFKKDGSVVSIPSNGEIVRVETDQELIGKVQGIPIMQTKYYPSDDGRLPEQKRGVYYIVSSLVAMCNPHRHDLVSPNTHPDSVIRDRNRNIIGVKSLQAFWRVRE